MIEPTALIDALAALTDSQRLDFARWAASQARPPVLHPESGDLYVARSANEDLALRAFNVLRNDDTAPPSWEFAFDPCFPETGWDAWRAAEVTVRAMAASLTAGDHAAFEQLVPAFEHLRLLDGNAGRTR